MEPRARLHCYAFTLTYSDPHEVADMINDQIEDAVADGYTVRDVQLLVRAVGQGGLVVDTFILHHD